ncbi:hypothetical protein SODALDRAFT_333697 [Sodiomyces alkalinus F11]|uniref:Uncharacterized protein n=1 Tax=Sodiomyces alkalinus (strain CBS 110278 / VKM F-3762 / F11) TaxID=1314773 RepID=A0A3N2PTU9_SODAK|nr:hypothetical protein SODALDRAFT_333697 [Sodiomyces alkalinus F11]ROT37932.1 hypothetical protein SODALDRAFT_333697 [Sodiomyces alkalinus F11]
MGIPTGIYWIMHLSPLPESSAIFSPTVARIAASNSKDWSFVDAWLASKFAGRSVPFFERNNETLKDLLALASVNEASDDECRRIALAESAALREIQRFNLALFGPSDMEPDASRQFRSAFLNDLEEFLSRDDQTFLDIMACVALELDIASPMPESLGDTLVQLQCRAFDLEEAHSRVHVMRNHINADIAKMEELLRCQRDWSYMPPSDQARHNLEKHRRTKQLSSKISELSDRLASLDAASFTSHPMIDQLADHEVQHSNLLAKKKGLEEEVSQFASLPETPDLARGQLERLRGELRSLAERRDVCFENLVERESPRKRP